MFNETPCLSLGNHQARYGIDALSLSSTPQTLRFRRPTPAGPAIPYLRLVNAHDYRQTARVWLEVQGVRQSLEVRIAAEWASWGFDLSAILGTQPHTWPTTLEVRVWAERHEVGLQSSLRPTDGLPSLLLGAQVPRSAWVAVPLAASPTERLQNALLSPANTDYLGWMLGSVSTGLMAWHQAFGQEQALQALQALLQGIGEGLPLEDLPATQFLGQSAEEVRNSRLESFLPVAALAYLQQQQPQPKRQQALEQLAQQMLEVANTPQPYLTTEGAYTLAFPLAAVGQALGKEELGQKAVELCLERWSFLCEPGHIVQRRYHDGRTHMVGWARGSAWLLLGSAWVGQTMGTSPLLLPLAQHFERCANWLMAQQQNGLWGVYTQRSSTAEASGSAGIAAALALGAAMGWLNPSARQAAKSTAAALESFLEPDGRLGGVSQHNPAGEEALQLEYRIGAAWGSGLYAQLQAALSGNIQQKQTT